MKYFKQIDSFRFFAAFSVLLAHWLHNNPTISKLRLGTIGVDFFFVVSGFLITYQLFQLRQHIQQKEVSIGKALRNFTFRRALRIIPLYLVVVLIATFFNKGSLMDDLVYNLTYTSNFHFIELQKWNSLTSHFWSLSVEEHFYIVWPIVILSSRKSLVLPIAIGLIIFSVGFRQVHFMIEKDHFTAGIHTLSCLDLFMFGSILAYFYHFKTKQFITAFSNPKIRFPFVIIILATYLLIILLPYSATFIWVYSRFFLALISALLIGLLITGFKGKLGSFFENKWLVLGGKLSYAIYLIHNFVPGILLEIKKLELPLFIEVLIFFTATVCFSYILNKSIELPMRKLGNRFKIRFHKN